MQPYRYRLLEPAELPQVWRLWISAAKYDACSAQVLHEKIFADADVSADLRIAAVDGHRLIGFAVGAVRNGLISEAGEPPLAYIKLMAVAPSYQRQGVGRSLLGQLESHCAALGATRCRFAESAPNYLTPGLDRRNQSALTFLRSQGYVPFGEAYNQKVTLQEQQFQRFEGRHGATGLSIRRASADDRDHLGRLLADHWPAWQSEVERALANDPVTVFVATDTTSVVAFAAFDANNVGTGWFGPMGTAPAARGLGLGRVLLHNCLADIQAEGHTQAIIPWVGPLEFYEHRAGAELSRTFDRLEKEI